MENTVTLAEQKVLNKVQQGIVSLEKFNEILEASKKLVITTKGVIGKLKQGVSLLAEALREKYQRELNQLQNKYDALEIPDNIGGEQLELTLHNINVDSKRMKVLEQKIANADKEAAAIVIGSTATLMSAIALVTRQILKSTI